MKYNFIFSLLFLSNSIRAQTWLPVGGSIDGHQVQSLYADSSQHLLYAGGLFSSAGGVYTRNIASWNGITWDSLNHGASNFTNVNSITKFDNKITASGAFFGSIPNLIAVWDGQQWDSLGSGINDVAWCFLRMNNELFVGGSFSQAGRQPAQRLAKWDGQNWYGYNLPFFYMNSDRIYSITEFNSEIYLGGNFIDTITWSIYCMGKLCQNQLCAVSSTQPFQGSAAVYKLIEFNHELIIAGEFNTQYGNNLVKWDGNSYSSFGGGTNGPVSDMLIWNNELYIAGNFTIVNGTPVSNIAKWDGNQWSRIGTSTFGNGILCMAVLDSELYVGGGFQEIDGQPITLIAKYSIPLSEIEHEKETSIYIYPIPCESELNFRIQNNVLGRRFIRICNILGSEFSSLQLSPNQNNFSVNTSSWAAGIYFVELITEEGRIVKKVIKN